MLIVLLFFLELLEVFTLDLTQLSIQKQRHMLDGLEEDGRLHFLGHKQLVILLAEPGVGQNLPYATDRTQPMFGVFLQQRPQQTPALLRKMYLLGKTHFLR